MTLVASVTTPLLDLPPPQEAAAVFGTLIGAFSLSAVLVRVMRTRAVNREKRRDEGNLHRRFVSLGVLALTLGIAITAGGWVYFAFLAVCTTVAVAELLTVVGERHALLLALPAGLSIFFAPLGPMAAMAALSLALLPSALFALRPPYSVSVASSVVALAAGLILIVLPAMLLGVMRQYPDGYLLTALIILVPQISDAFALLFGRYFGQHQLAPRLSPGKTVEGAIGGLAAGITVSLLLSNGLESVGIAIAIGLGALLVGAGIIGDLVASTIKRSVGVDDFGRLLPGHGGLLDRVDSLMFAVPLGVFAYSVQMVMG
ncbi:phosphatidate cytidylyltransferase [Vreelandella massiliensis]|uniref:phosphatidate cytidylyltransferase n=1 Tax=Vreelandella massiliensis TaxID=1816686 RepID=UPI00096A7884|nr:phosphatidate cytidylyltransferase [Halomonas massiliensis]